MLLDSLEERRTAIVWTKMTPNRMVDGENPRCGPMTLTLEQTVTVRPRSKIYRSRP